MGLGLFSDDIVLDILRPRQKVTSDIAKKFSTLNQNSYNVPGPVLVRGAQQNIDDAFLSQLQDRVIQQEESSWKRLKSNVYRNVGIGNDVGIPTLMFKALGGAFLWAWENTIPRAARTAELMQQKKDLDFGQAWKKADVQDPLSRFMEAREEGETVDIGSGMLQIQTNPEETATYQQLIDEGVSPEIARAIALEQLGEPIFKDYVEEAETKVQFTGARAEALRKRGVTPTVTPGRYLFKPLEFIVGPHTEAYDFLTGVVDFALNWYVDPANRVLRGVSAVSKRRGMFGLGEQKTFAALTSAQADSMGFLEKGLQKVARQRPLEDFLASDDMVPFLSWMYDNRKNGATIMEKSNFNLVRLSEVEGKGSKQFTQFYSKLKNLDKRGKFTNADDAVKADAVRKLLKPNIVAAASMNAVPAVKKVGRTRRAYNTVFGKGSKIGFDEQRQFGQVYDHTTMDVNDAGKVIAEYTKMMAFQGVEEVTRNKRVNALLNGLEEIGDNQLARANFINGAIASDLLRTRYVTKEALEKSGPLSKDADTLLELATKTSAGYLEDAQDIGRFYGSMDVSMPVYFKPQFIKYLKKSMDVTDDVAEGLFEASYRYPIFENQMLTTITLPKPSTWIKATRALDKSLSGQLGKVTDILGEKAVMGMLDNYYSGIFKPFALLRIAYLVRVQIEEQARLAASGINSLYTHPIQHITNIMNGTYQKAEGVVGSNFYKYNAYNVQLNSGFTSRLLKKTGGSKYTRESWEQISKERVKEFNEGWYSDVIGSANTPLFKEIARIESTIVKNKTNAYKKLYKRLITEDDELHKSMIALTQNKRHPLHSVFRKNATPEELEEAIYQYMYFNRAEVHSLLGGTIISKEMQKMGRAPLGDTSLPAVDTYNWVESVAGDDILKTFARGKFKSKSGKEVDLDLTKQLGIDEVTLKKYRNNELPPSIQKRVYKEINKMDEDIKKMFLNKYNPQNLLPDSYRVTIPPPVDAATKSRWDKATAWGFKWLSQIPANEMSRSPAFFGYYYKNIQSLIPTVTEGLKKEIIKMARKDKVSKKLIKQMENTPSAGKSGIKDLVIIDKLSASKAADQAMQLLYDISKKGDFWETTRLIFPFGGAYQEIFQTWARLMRANLSLATRPTQVSLSGVKPNPVFDSDSEKGFFYKNPTNGEMVFGYPGEGLIQDWMLGGDSDNVKVNLPVYAQSINLAASILPGVGPIIRLPASYLYKNYPEEGFINKLIFGDFEPPNLKDPTEIAKAVGAYPAWVQKLTNVILPRDENTVGSFGNAVMDTYRAMIYAGIITDSPEDRERGLEMAVQQARYVYLVRFASQFVGPAGTASPLYELETKNGDFYFFQTLADEYREIKRINYGDDVEATKQFIEKFGINPIALTVGKTTTVEKRPVTKEGSFWMQQNKEIYNDYPLVAFYANPEPVYADLSWGQIKDNYMEGSAVPRTPEQHAALQAKIKGFVAFTQWERDMGLVGNNSKAAKQLKQQYQDNLAQQYWGYGFDEIVGLPTKPTLDQQIEQLYSMSNDPRVAELEAMKGLKLYLKRRDILIEEVEKATGSKTIWRTSDDYIAIRNLLRNYGKYLVAQYPQFNSVYQNLLKSELQGEMKDKILTGEASG